MARLIVTYHHWLVGSWYIPEVYTIRVNTKARLIPEMSLHPASIPQQQQHLLGLSTLLSESLEPPLYWLSSFFKRDFSSGSITNVIIIPM